MNLEMEVRAFHGRTSRYTAYYRGICLGEFSTAEAAWRAVLTMANLIVWKELSHVR